MEKAAPQALPILFWMLLGAVALAPLPFASVLPWAWGPLAGVTALLMVIWGLKTGVAKEDSPTGLSKTCPFVVPFGLAVIWAALQSADFLPAPWSNPLWRDASAALGMDVSGSVSVDPGKTRSALVRLMTYGGIFWLALHYCRIAAQARLAIQILAFTGLAYAAYGLIIDFSGAQTVLWYRKLAYQDVLTSTFVNRNSYATYAGLGLICAIGLLVRHITKALGSGPSAKQTVRGLLDALAGSGALLLVACVALVTSLLLTQSRGGFVSTTLGLLALVTAISATRMMSWRQSAIMAAGIAIVGSIFFAYSGTVVSERLAKLEGRGELPRERLFDITIDGIRDAPVFGTGYGTFGDVFFTYRPDDFRISTQRAHNTYLENALELGLPAAGLLVFGIAVLFLRCVIGVRVRRRNTIYPCIGIGATVLVASHSLVDFSLQMPAVAATYALIMGAAVAQSWASSEAA